MALNSNKTDMASFEEAKRELGKILGDAFVTNRLTFEFMLSRKGQDLLGWMDNEGKRIALSYSYNENGEKFVNNRTIRHEAIHFIIDNLLSDDLRTKIYEQARAEMGENKSDVDEYIAEKYELFREKYGEVGGSGVTGWIKFTFDKWKSAFLNLFGQKDYISTLFYKADSGKFVSETTSYIHDLPLNPLTLNRGRASALNTVIKSLNKDDVSVEVLKRFGSNEVILYGAKKYLFKAIMSTTAYGRSIFYDFNSREKSVVGLRDKMYQHVAKYIEKNPDMAQYLSMPYTALPSNLINDKDFIALWFYKNMSDEQVIYDYFVSSIFPGYRSGEINTNEYNEEGIKLIEELATISEGLLSDTGGQDSIQTIATKHIDALGKVNRSLKLLLGSFDSIHKLPETYAEANPHLDVIGTEPVDIDYVFSFLLDQAVSAKQSYKGYSLENFVGYVNGTVETYLQQVERVEGDYISEQKLNKLYSIYLHIFSDNSFSFVSRSLTEGKVTSLGQFDYLINSMSYYSLTKKHRIIAFINYAKSGKILLDGKPLEDKHVLTLLKRINQIHRAALNVMTLIDSSMKSMMKVSYAQGKHYVDSNREQRIKPTVVGDQTYYRTKEQIVLSIKNKFYANEGFNEDANFVTFRSGNVFDFKQIDLRTHAIYYKGEHVITYDLGVAGQGRSIGYVKEGVSSSTIAAMFNSLGVSLTRAFVEQMNALPELSKIREVKVYNSSLTGGYKGSEYLLRVLASFIFVGDSASSIYNEAKSRKEVNGYDDIASRGYQPEYQENSASWKAAATLGLLPPGQHNSTGFENNQEEATDVKSREESRSYGERKVVTMADLFLQTNQLAEFIEAFSSLTPRKFTRGVDGILISLTNYSNYLIDNINEAGDNTSESGVVATMDNFDPTVSPVIVTNPNGLLARFAPEVNHNNRHNFVNPLYAKGESFITRIYKELNGKNKGLFYDTMKIKHFSLFEGIESLKKSASSERMHDHDYLLLVLDQFIRSATNSKGKEFTLPLMQQGDRKNSPIVDVSFGIPLYFVNDNFELEIDKASVIAHMLPIMEYYNNVRMKSISNLKNSAFVTSVIDTLIANARVSGELVDSFIKKYRITNAEQFLSYIESGSSYEIRPVIQTLNRHLAMSMQSAVNAHANDLASARPGLLTKKELNEIFDIAYHEFFRSMGVETTSDIIHRSKIKDYSASAYVDNAVVDPVSYFSELSSTIDVKLGNVLNRSVDVNDATYNSLYSKENYNAILKLFDDSTLSKEEKTNAIYSILYYGNTQSVNGLSDYSANISGNGIFSHALRLNNLRKEAGIGYFKSTTRFKTENQTHRKIVEGGLTYTSIMDNIGYMSSFMSSEKNNWMLGTLPNKSMIGSLVTDILSIIESKANRGRSFNENMIYAISKSINELVSAMYNMGGHLDPKSDTGKAVSFIETLLDIDLGIDPTSDTNVTVLDIKEKLMKKVNNISKDDQEHAVKTFVNDLYTNVFKKVMKGNYVSRRDAANNGIVRGVVETLNESFGTLYDISEQVVGLSAAYKIVDAYQQMAFIGPESNFTNYSEYIKRLGNTMTPGSLPSIYSPYALPAKMKVVYMSESNKTIANKMLAKHGKNIPNGTNGKTDGWDGYKIVNVNAYYGYVNSFSEDSTVLPTQGNMIKDHYIGLDQNTGKFKLIKNAGLLPNYNDVLNSAEMRNIQMNLNYLDAPIVFDINKTELDVEALANMVAVNVKFDGMTFDLNQVLINNLSALNGKSYNNLFVLRMDMFNAINSALENLANQYEQAYNLDNVLSGNQSMQEYVSLGINGIQNVDKKQVSWNLSGEYIWNFIVNSEIKDALNYQALPPSAAKIGYTHLNPNLGGDIYSEMVAQNHAMTGQTGITSDYIEAKNYRIVLNTEAETQEQHIKMTTQMLLQMSNSKDQKVAEVFNNMLSNAVNAQLAELSKKIESFKDNNEAKVVYIKKYVKDLIQKRISETGERDIYTDFLQNDDVSLNVPFIAERVLNILVSDLNKIVGLKMNGIRANQAPNSYDIYRIKGSAIAYTEEEVVKFFGEEELAKAKLNISEHVYLDESGLSHYEFLDENGNEVAHNQDLNTVRKVTPAEIGLALSNMKSIGISPNDTLNDFFHYTHSNGTVHNLNAIQYNSDGSEIRAPQRIVDLMMRKELNPQFLKKFLEARLRVLSKSGNGEAIEHLMDCYKEYIAAYNGDTNVSQGRIDDLIGFVSDFYDKLDNAITVFGTRTPFNGMSNMFVGRVAYMLPYSSSTTYISSENNALNNSDFDIDQLSIFFKNESKDKTMEVFNTLFDTIYNYFTNPVSVDENGKMNNSLYDYMRPLVTSDFDSIIEKTRAGRNMRYNDLATSIQVRNAMKQDNAIGIMANVLMSSYHINGYFYNNADAGYFIHQRISELLARNPNGLVFSNAMTETLTQVVLNNFKYGYLGRLNIDLVSGIVDALGYLLVTGHFINSDTTNTEQAFSNLVAFVNDSKVQSFYSKINDSKRIGSYQINQLDQIEEIIGTRVQGLNNYANKASDLIRELVRNKDEWQDVNLKVTEVPAFIKRATDKMKSLASSKNAEKLAIQEALSNLQEYYENGLMYDILYEAIIGSEVMRSINVALKPRVKIESSSSEFENQRESVIDALMIRDLNSLTQVDQNGKFIRTEAEIDAAIRKYMDERFANFPIVKRERYVKRAKAMLAMFPVAKSMKSNAYSLSAIRTLNYVSKNYGGDLFIHKSAYAKQIMDRFKALTKQYKFFNADVIKTFEHYMFEYTIGEYMKNLPNEEKYLPLMNFDLTSSSKAVVEALKVGTMPGIVTLKDSNGKNVHHIDLSSKEGQSIFISLYNNYVIEFTENLNNLAQGKRVQINGVEKVYNKGIDYFLNYLEIEQKNYGPIVKFKFDFNKNNSIKLLEFRKQFATMAETFNGIIEPSDIELFKKMGLMYQMIVRKMTISNGSMIELFSPSDLNGFYAFMDKLHSDLKKGKSQANISMMVDELAVKMEDHLPSDLSVFEYKNSLRDVFSGRSYNFILKDDYVGKDESDISQVPTYLSVPLRKEGARIAVPYVMKITNKGKMEDMVDNIYTLYNQSHSGTVGLGVQYNGIGSIYSFLAYDTLDTKLQDIPRGQFNLLGLHQILSLRNGSQKSVVIRTPGNYIMGLYLSSYGDVLLVKQTGRSLTVSLAEGWNDMRKGANSATKANTQFLIDKVQVLFPNLSIVVYNNDTMSKYGAKPNEKGFVKNGVVHLNMDKLTMDTPFHEIVHIMTGLIKQNNNALYEELKSFAFKNGYYDYIKSSNEYSSLDSDDIYQEAIAYGLGMILGAKAKMMMHLEQSAKTAENYDALKKEFIKEMFGDNKLLGITESVNGLLKEIMESFASGKAISNITSDDVNAIGANFTLRVFSYL